MSEQRHSTSSITLFFSYAHEDESLQNELEKHLNLLQRQGIITTWYDRQIVPGTNWTHAIDSHLQEADIVLLLISPDFIASDYCYGHEMQVALDRHKQGLTHVIPVLLRPCDWQDAPFSHLQCLPSNKLPVTLWENQDSAFFEVVIGIRAAIARLHDPMIQRISRSSTPISSQARHRLLKRVRTRWIQDVLEQSLHRVALITLGLQEQPDALANPWSFIVQETERPARSLPSGTRITQVYDEADGTLLILGEPGSGKTTLLLDLARELLDRAEQDEAYRMPVVFNLSSWAVKRQPLADWLAEELNLRYQVPSRLAQSWITTDCILPLLDGLDEVAPTHRIACLKEINTYRANHDLAPLVVCSRSEEYFSLTTRIQLYKAVTIQPLTIQQIDEYLISAGEQLTALHTVLHRDTVLLKLATTPLMLSILALTYHGKTIEELPITGSFEKRRQQVFAAYVQRMFEHRGAAVSYTRQQTIVWLGWLAGQMAIHNQTEFYLENMQPDWIWQKNLRRCYEWTVGTPMLYLMRGLASAMYNGISAILMALLVTILSIRVSNEALGTLFSVFPGGIAIILTSGILYGWHKIAYRVIAGLLTGAMVGALIYSIPTGIDKLVMGLIVGLVTGCIISLLDSTIHQNRYSAIHLEPVIGWSWKEVLQSLDRKNKLLQVALVRIIIGSILVGTIIGVEKGIVRGLEMGGIIVAGGLLFFSLASGIQEKTLDKRERIAPNQSLKRSAYKGLYFFLVNWICAFLGTWLLISSVAGMAMGLFCAFIAGILFGINQGWFSDWDACLRHLVLRALLWQAGSIPRTYTRFLDYAVDRIFLRKTGGGYIFIHRQLLEYFAQLTILEIEIEHNQDVKPDAKDALIYHKRGLVLAACNKYEQAIKNYTSAIELDPKEISFYRDRGFAYARCKKHQQAITDYTFAINLDPKNAWSYRQRGLAYDELEAYDKAIADFTQAIELEPERALTYRYRGWSYHYNKESEKAIADFTHTITLAPQDPWNYRSRSRIYTDLQEYDKAIADLSIAIELAPDEAEFYRSRRWAYFLNDQREKAIADFTRTIELEPQNARLYAERGSFYMLQKEYDKAFADFNRSIELAPSNARLYGWRGNAFLQMDAYEQAIEDFTRSIELDTSYKSAYLNRGRAYLRLKERELAHADFAQYAALTPESIEAEWMAIFSKLGKQRPGSEIIEALAKIVAINPQSEDAQFCQNIALGLQNNFNEGLAALERLIPLIKTMQEDAYFWKGLFHAYLGQDAEARQAITQALDIGLPPVLLTPLYWLEQERPEMYQAVAVPFLVQYGI